METDLPIYGHNRTDFTAAVKLYRSVFSSEPPGSGESEERYQMIRSALDLGIPATESDLARWKESAPPEQDSTP